MADDSGNIVDVRLGNNVIIKVYKGSELIFNPAQDSRSGAKGGSGGKKKEIHVVTDVYTPKDDEELTR